MKTLAVISLGCDKNRVDTERMLARLADGEFRIVSEDEAQIIIINTCAFIEAARKEAIDTILRAAQYKNDKCEKLIVTGCLPQRYSEELYDELPEVDAFLGVGDYDEILDVINSAFEGKRSSCVEIKDEKNEIRRVLSTPSHYAYLKIAEGCDNHCTYCAIPAIRGKFISRSLESLAEEAADLCSRGVEELILVAQNVTEYGKDIYGKPSLPLLIRKLSEYDFKRIRLLYCYPELIDDELIAEIRDNPKVVKYIDIPLQHIDDDVLKLMGRKSTSAEIKSLIDKLRREIPQIALRSTFIAGFPRETEEQHLRLLEFIKEYRLEHAGSFAYSREEGTPAARLTGQIPAAIKEKRRRSLDRAQREVVKQLNAERVGQVYDVLYEGIDYDKNLFYGRAYWQAPEIDSVIYFKAKFADIGNFYKVKITKADGFNLIGEVVE